MSNIEVDSSDEEYSPKASKHRHSWPTKPLNFSAKYNTESNPFGISSQASPKKASKRGSKAKTNGSNHKFNTGRWSKEEHKLFLEAIEIHGRDWKKVQDYVGTRTSTQARSHAQKVLPHPANLDGNLPFHNSSSTTMTKGSPPSVKTNPVPELRQDLSDESDEGSNEFQIFKVEKIRRPIIGRDRVNSENNVSMFNLGASEFVADREHHLKQTIRKYSMNNDNFRDKGDLIGISIKESIKEQFFEDEDEEEAKEQMFHQHIEKQKTFEPQHIDAFDNYPLFSFNKEYEMNLESIAQKDWSDFPMDVDEDLAPWNSLQIMSD